MKIYIIAKDKVHYFCINTKDTVLYSYIISYHAPKWVAMSKSGGMVTSTAFDALINTLIEQVSDDDDKVAVTLLRNNNITTFNTQSWIKHL